MKTRDDAVILADRCSTWGGAPGREVVCLLTDMSQPLGSAVGNALEIREAVDTSAAGPPDSPSSCSTRAARLLALADLGIDVAEGRRRAEAAVADGSALEAYERWIRAQGGDPDLDRLPTAAVVGVTAPREGVRDPLDALASESRRWSSVRASGEGRSDRPCRRRRLPGQARRRRVAGEPFSPRCTLRRRTRGGCRRGRPGCIRARRRGPAPSGCVCSK